MKPWDVTTDITVEITTDQRVIQDVLTLITYSEGYPDILLLLYVFIWL